MPKMLSVKEVVDTLGISVATLWRLRKSGSFPACRQLSAKRIGWTTTDIADWMATR